MRDGLSFNKSILLCGALAAISVGTGSTASAAPAYNVTGLGVPSGGRSYARGINGNGEVVGSVVSSSGYQNAFAYHGGAMNDLATAGGGGAYVAAADNDFGQIVGQSQSQTSVQALLWSASGSIQSLGNLGGNNSWATGINNSGEVVGAAETNNINGFFYAFRWTAAGGMQNLGNLGGSGGGSYATAISSSGAIVGGSAPAGTTSLTFHAFLWTASGGMQDLGTLGGDSSYAYSVNTSSEVVGQALTTNGESAFLWAKGGTGGPAGNPQMRDLGSLGGPGSGAYGINDAGEVVGTADIANNAGFHAFIWTDSGGMQDLNNLIPAKSGWTLEKATGINVYGDIVGYGINPAGNTEAFLLTPVPEPAALAIFALGFAGLGLCRRKNAMRNVAA